MYVTLDVCNEPVSTGPCTEWQTLYYYNRENQTCEPFTYGGCEGTGNRFNDLYECETVCLAGREPHSASAAKGKHNEMAMRSDFQFKICYLCSLAQVDICRLPVEMGHCNGYAVQERRWYYDDERGTCISFIYSGCSGNQNNFRSFEACTNQCGSKTLPPATWQLTPIHSTSECILRTLSIRLRRNLNLL